jgi:hypothetical protein
VPGQINLASGLEQAIRASKAAFCREWTGLPGTLSYGHYDRRGGGPFDAIFSANLTHIAPWAATEGLIKGAAARLGQGGLLLIYGPFSENGSYTGPGNAAFDADLRMRNPD